MPTLTSHGLNNTVILGHVGKGEVIQVWREHGVGVWDVAFSPDGNRIASVGAFVIAVGVLLFVINVFYTWKKGAVASLDPWDARTLEWSIASPPQEYNFKVIPTVHARDAFWYEKHHRDEIEAEQAAHTKDEQSHGGIHMPYGSIWPLVTGLGILIVAIAITMIPSNPAPGIHWRLGVTLFGGAVAGGPVFEEPGNGGGHLSTLPGWRRRNGFRYGAKPRRARRGWRFRHRWRWRVFYEPLRPSHHCAAKAAEPHPSALRQ